MKLKYKVLIFATVICAINCEPEYGQLASPVLNSLPNSMPEAYTSLEELNNILKRGKNLLNILPHMGIEMGGKILNFIPTASEILNFGKQTLIGLPQEVIAYAINSVCSSAVHLNAIKPTFTPDVDEMNFMLITPDNFNITIPIRYPEQLWNHPKFRMSWKVVILVTGWNSNINITNMALETLYEAYRCRDDYNFVVIDTAQFVDTLYTWSAFSTNPIGEIIGEAIVGLTKFVSLEDIHLIGHSLGAHIVGDAGRAYTKLSNRTLPRITGLDPARPCFNEGERLKGLQRGDAEFVDIIHTNAGILGIKDPIGDVDFFPNGRDPLQPGCWTIVCAHSRAYQFYAETVYPGNEYNFMSTQCSSIRALKLGKCSGRVVPMGFATPTSARGNYYLLTNKKPPFGTSHAWQFGKKRHPKCKNPNKI